MKNKKLTLEQERHARIIRDSKCRGGRTTQVVKDKKKYDRKRDKKVPTNDEV